MRLRQALIPALLTATPTLTGCGCVDTAEDLTVDAATGLIDLIWGDGSEDTTASEDAIKKARDKVKTDLEEEAKEIEEARRAIADARVKAAEERTALRVSGEGPIVDCTEATDELAAIDKALKLALPASQSAFDNLAGDYSFGLAPLLDVTLPFKCADNGERRIQYTGSGALDEQELIARLTYVPERGTGVTAIVLTTLGMEILEESPCQLVGITGALGACQHFSDGNPSCSSFTGPSAHDGYPGGTYGMLAESIESTCLSLESQGKLSPTGEKPTDQLVTEREILGGHEGVGTYIFPNGKMVGEWTKEGIFTGNLTYQEGSLTITITNGIFAKKELGKMPNPIKAETASMTETARQWTFTGEIEGGIYNGTLSPNLPAPADQIVGPLNWDINEPHKRPTRVRNTAASVTYESNATVTDHRDFVLSGPREWQPNGNVTLTWPDNSLFEMKFVNGLPDNTAKGKYTTATGTEYVVSPLATPGTELKWEAHIVGTPAGATKKTLIFDPTDFSISFS